jgi:hypothetical protein
MPGDAPGAPFTVCLAGDRDPSIADDEPAPKLFLGWTEGKRSAFYGLCMAIVQGLKQPGSLRVSASAPGLKSIFVLLKTASAGLRLAAI